MTKQLNTCPFCEAEVTGHSVSGMNAVAMAELKKIHDQEYGGSIVSAEALSNPTTNPIFISKNMATPTCP